MSVAGRAKSVPQSCHDMLSKIFWTVADEEKVTLQSVFAAAAILLAKHTIHDLSASNAKLSRIHRSLHDSLDRVNDSGVEIPPEIMEIGDPYLHVLA